ncbi:U3 small nucleolar RNA-associated protein 6-domain-containing protein [Limtongia smithiae]|uniref:U3 small nucleolar RNA-associated protein 6-domain-containing protein n=1 Tax=Limtongia smithiae TaxID=1125753 RepID=UPI0034CEA0A7
MAERVRYRLEQTLPDLAYLQRHKIFTQSELAAISRRRSEFEHRVNNRGATLLDFLKYAEYEINLDALRRRRCLRLSVAPQGGRDGAGGTSLRFVYSVFARGVKRFPGDVGLWKQYLAFAREQKARRLLNKLFTTVLRLHPKESSLWVLAAEHELRANANRLAARNILLRGIKFNPDAADIAQAYETLEKDVREAVDAAADTTTTNKSDMDDDKSKDDS